MMDSDQETVIFNSPEHTQDHQRRYYQKPSDLPQRITPQLPRDPRTTNPSSSHYAYNQYGPQSVPSVPRPGPSSIPPHLLGHSAHSPSPSSSRLYPNLPHPVPSPSSGQYSGVFPHMYPTHLSSHVSHPSSSYLPHQYSNPSPAQYSSIHQSYPTVSGNVSTSQNHHPHPNAPRVHIKRKIIFPGRRTRYTSMRLSVGSLDKSGKSFLESLSINKTRVKSCWEREIIANVPSSRKPAENAMVKEEDGMQERERHDQESSEASKCRSPSRTVTKTPSATNALSSRHTHPSHPSQPIASPQRGSPNHRHTPQSSNEGRTSSLSHQTKERHEGVPATALSFLKSMLKGSSYSFANPAHPQDSSKDAAVPPEEKQAPKEDTVSPKISAALSDPAVLRNILASVKAKEQREKDQKRVLVNERTAHSSPHSDPPPPPPLPPSNSPPLPLSSHSHCPSRDRRERERRSLSQSTSPPPPPPPPPLSSPHSHRPSRDRREREGRSLSQSTSPPPRARHSSDRRGREERSPPPYPSSRHSSTDRRRREERSSSLSTPPPPSPHSHHSSTDRRRREERSSSHSTPPPPPPRSRHSSTDRRGREESSSSLSTPPPPPPRSLHSSADRRGREEWQERASPTPSELSRHHRPPSPPTLPSPHRRGGEERLSEKDKRLQRLLASGSKREARSPPSPEDDRRRRRNLRAERSPRKLTRRKETTPEKAEQEAENHTDHWQREKTDKNEERRKVKEIDTMAGIADRRQGRDERSDENLDVRIREKSLKQKRDEDGRRGGRDSTVSPTRPSRRKPTTEESSIKKSRIGERNSTERRISPQRRLTKERSATRGERDKARKLSEGKTREKSDERIEADGRTSTGEVCERRNYKKRSDDAVEGDRETGEENSRNTDEETDGNRYETNRREGRDGEAEKSQGKERRERGPRKRSRGRKRNRKRKVQLSDEDEEIEEERKLQRSEEKTHSRHQRDKRRESEGREDSERRKRAIDEEKVNAEPSRKRYKRMDASVSSAEKNDISPRRKTFEREERSAEENTAPPPHRRKGTRESKTDRASLHRHRTSSGAEELMDTSLHHSLIIEGRSTTDSLHKHGGDESTNASSLHHDRLSAEESEASPHQTVGRDGDNSASSPQHQNTDERSTPTSLLPPGKATQGQASLDQETNLTTSLHIKTEPGLSLSSSCEENRHAISPHPKIRLVSGYSSGEETRPPSRLLFPDVVLRQSSLEQITEEPSSCVVKTEEENRPPSPELFPEALLESTTTLPPKSLASNSSPACPVFRNVVVKEEPPDLPDSTSEGLVSSPTSPPSESTSLSSCILQRDLVAVKDESLDFFDVRETKLANTARVKSEVTVRVKEEPPEEYHDAGESVSLRISPENDAAAATTPPPQVKIEQEGYMEVTKSEPFLEEDGGNHKKVRKLMKATMQTLGLDIKANQGIPKLWDGSTPESLYDHLQSWLVEMGCGVWEAPNASFTFTWEVNLRRIAVASIAKNELESFTRDIYRHMKEQPSYSGFVKELMRRKANT